MRRTAALVILVVARLLRGLRAAERRRKDVYVKTVRHREGLPPRARLPDPVLQEHACSTPRCTCPATWFKFGGAGKAAVVWGNTDEFPYMAIYYADGKFDRIVLYLHSNMNDLTWGTLPAGHRPQRAVRRAGTAEGFLALQRHAGRRAHRSGHPGGRPLRMAFL